MGDEHEKAARENVDRHIGDVVTGDDDPEDIACEAYTLAFDGAVDAGATHEHARAIAQRISKLFGGG